MTPEERQAMRDRLAPAAWTFNTDATPRWSSRAVSGGEAYMLEAWLNGTDHNWRVVHLAAWGPRVLAGGAHRLTLQEAQTAAEVYLSGASSPGGPTRSGSLTPWTRRRPTSSCSMAGASAATTRLRLPTECKRWRVAEARVTELEGLVDEARVLLGKVEWAAENDCGDYCPACGDYRDQGHKPDCPLAAWLAKTAPKEADHG
jgi:hypothetical protein